MDVGYTIDAYMRAAGGDRSELRSVGRHWRRRPLRELINGAPVNDLEGANGSESFYTFDVPPGVNDLTFNLVGGSGDADLYVRFGLHPSTSDYDCRSWDDGNGDGCSFPESQAGTYHVLVYADKNYSGASRRFSHRSRRISSRSAFGG